MREDRFTNTPEDAARYEAMRGPDDYYDDRPTLAEATADLGADPVCPPHDWDAPAWVCRRCRAVCR